MSTDLLPDNIAEIIDQKHQALLEERHRQEEAEAREHAELEAIGRAKYEQFIQESLQKVPDYLRPYIDHSFSEPDFYRIGKGWDDVNRLDLAFDVPGLAMIVFDPIKSLYKAARANWSPSWDEGPQMQFGDSSYWDPDVEIVLLAARNAMSEFQKLQGQYAAQQAQEAAEQERRKQHEEAALARAAEREARAEAEEARDRTEEEILFDVLRNDAVALWMVKAYLLISNERASFRRRLEEADWHLYGLEEQLSRQGESLNRLAEEASEAERRADDERRQLQSDVDTLEARLKKAERGW